jgi:hypothetical protein
MHAELDGAGLARWSEGGVTRTLRSLSVLSMRRRREHCKNAAGQVVWVDARRWARPHWTKSGAVDSRLVRLADGWQHREDSSMDRAEDAGRRPRPTHLYRVVTP